MARKSKTSSNLVAADSFTLGGRTFVVKPIASRGTEEAYDEAAEFLLLSTPIITKLFSSVTSAGILVEDKDLSTMPALEQIGLVLDLAEDLGITTMLGDIVHSLPKLCAIACHGTDPSITPGDVKRMAGSPINPELLRAVIMQLGADQILTNLINLGALFVGNTTEGDSDTGVPGTAGIAAS